MSKLLVILVLLASVLFIACASGTTPTPRAEEGPGQPYDVQSQTGGKVTIVNEGDRAPGPIGPAGPAAAAKPAGGVRDRSTFLSSSATPAPYPPGIPPPRPAAAPAAIPAPAAPPPSPHRPEDSEAVKVLGLSRDSQDTSAKGPQEAKASGLETAQRKVISTAWVSIEVEQVSAAIAQVRVVAESLGGFVEQLASSGDPERPQATITLRVPQAQFFDALERVEALGKVQGRKVGSEDVSERFIDLKARLQSSLREEQSLLSLLAKTQNVSEVLTVERELTRVRSEIERLQGQLNFIERRVELATISVSLSPPKEKVAEAPSGSLSVAVPDVPATVGNIKALVVSLKGVVDRVFVSGEKGAERANLVIRVFAADFTRALTAVESEGEVKAREVRESAPHNPADAPAAKEPNARMEISLTVPDPTEPPAASVVVEVSDVGATVGKVRALVAGLNGAVDRSLLSVRDGEERADLSLRVFRGDFPQGIEVLEGLGMVQSKEVREAPAPGAKSGVRGRDPDARINVLLIEAGSGVWLVVAIAAPLGGMALAVLLGSAFYLNYRAGRRRGGQAL